ncbi:putative bifunctional diguanylate cyclase/phosphodiesterase [Stakelama marina]|uniref:EAL domain-containing protein n=1 Tax=Stakelama marina TaxID=2826939 RepID=A0A8T4IHG8_9SPHN|nr:GGDEF domain-containing phosphodiesterase [Stakelama marina]MBR0553324.1 EAL domain-containing protein [Stakelama marina]
MAATGLLVPLLLVAGAPDDTDIVSLSLCAVAVVSAALGLHALFRRDDRLARVSQRLDSMLETLSISIPEEQAGAVDMLEARMDALGGAVDSVRHRFARRNSATGLPTREPLLERIRDDLSHAASGTLGVFEFVEFERLSGFDPDVADRTITALAKRIGSMVGQSQHLSQLDRSRFGIWFAGRGRDQTESGIEAIRYALGDAIAVDGREILPEIRAGSASAPDDGSTAEALLAAAISSLADDGGDGTAAGSTSVGARVREAFSLEQDLRRAVAQGELELDYQPLIDAAERRICGAEALVRWRHPTRGRISPGCFIPIAERIGLAEEIGMWALNAACRQARQWRGAGLDRFRVAVNLSARQLDRDDLPAMIQRTMSRHALEPGMLEIELTETVAAGDVARAARLFDALRELGIAIAIDDFGTGFASLSYLRQLAFDKLKIDREFVTEVDKRPASQAICQSLLALGRGLGIRVLAEGVERAEEYLWLRQQGCGHFQGYYFAKPMAPEQLTALANDNALAGRIAVSAPQILQQHIRTGVQ